MIIVQTEPGSNGLCIQHSHNKCINLKISDLREFYFPLASSDASRNHRGGLYVAASMQNPHLKEFYRDNSAIVFYDNDIDTLFLEYTGKVMSEDHFIKINSALLAAFKTLSTQKFIADIRKMGIISVNSQKWVIEFLLPEMVKHLKGRKLFHAQLLDPSEILSKVSGGNIKNKSSMVIRNLEMMQFNDPVEMRSFLKSWRP